MGVGLKVGRRGGHVAGQSLHRRLVGRGVEIDHAALVLVHRRAGIDQGDERLIALGGAGVVGDGLSEAFLPGGDVARGNLRLPGQHGHLPLGGFGAGDVVDSVVLANGRGVISLRQVQRRQPRPVGDGLEALGRGVERPL